MELTLWPALGWYGLGHLLVLLVALVAIRIVRRVPPLEARRDAIFELNVKQARIEAGQTELAVSRGELNKLKQLIQQVRDKIETYVQLDDPPSTTLAYFLLALILAEGEAAVLLLLSGPSHFLGLSLQMWAFAAVPAAFIGVTAMHVLLGTLLGDKRRPARTVRRAKVGAVVCGTIVIIGTWLTLSGRNLTDVDLIAQMAGIGLMALSILLSLTAAFCSIIATTVYEAQSHERKLAHLELQQEAYVRHMELVEKDITRLQGSADSSHATAPTVQPAQTTPTAGTAAPAGVLPTMMVLLLLGLPALGFAQTAPTVPSTSTEAPRASVPLFARLGACEVLVDTTSSVDREPLVRTVAQVSDMLPLITDAYNCTLIRVTPFAGDLFTSISEFDIPAPPDPDQSCRTATAPQGTALQQAVRHLYPSLTAASADRARTTCLEQQKPKIEQGRAARTTAITRAADRLRATDFTDGPCTALPHAIQRALVRSQYITVITDGIPTCTPPHVETTLPADGELVFLLIPSGEPTAATPALPGGAQPRDRATLLLRGLATWQQRYENSIVLLAPEATPAFWRGRSKR